MHKFKTHSLVYLGIFMVMSGSAFIAKRLLAEGDITSSNNYYTIQPTNGYCGTANGKTFLVTPAENLCSAGVMGNMRLSTSIVGWEWNCVGANGGSSAQCKAYKIVPVNGVCGLANGSEFTEQPIDGLCAKGRPTTVFSDGSYWRWYCQGENGGSAINCQARKKIETTSPVQPEPLIPPTNTSLPTPAPTSAPTPVPAQTETQAQQSTNTTSTTIKTDSISSDDSDEEQIIYSKIIKPLQNALINGNTIVIEVEALGAGKVEIYAKRENASQEMYIGLASKISDKLWKLEKALADSMPNGNYTIFARIRNSQGMLMTDEVKIRVNRIIVKEESGNLIETAENNDSDGDGLNDAEEIRMGTSPTNPDSDEDGFIDGDEIEGGYDPKKYSSGDKSDKILFQSPKDQGNHDSKYEVSSVDLMVKKVPVTDDPNIQEEQKVLKLNGKALPNAFVTVYIYSNTPIVVTVKTDDQGNWSYELDKELEDGEHEAYVAVTDNTGKITAKSEPLKFVKTAQAATVIPNASASNSEESAVAQSPVEQSKNNFISFAFLTVVIFLGLALIMIGAMTYKKHNQ